MKQWRAANPRDSVFVHIGDEFQGTLWSTYYKGKEAALFDNLVGVEVAVRDPPHLPSETEEGS